MFAHSDIAPEDICNEPLIFTNGSNPNNQPDMTWALFNPYLLLFYMTDMTSRTWREHFILFYLKAWAYRIKIERCETQRTFFFNSYQCMDTVCIKRPTLITLMISKSQISVFKHKMLKIKVDINLICACQASGSNVRRLSRQLHLHMHKG